ncbi:hypothetical protein V2J09_022318 [Rumex salicifolius]
MEQRLANTWQMTENEKHFIETALLSNLRIDGRRPYEYRELTIEFDLHWFRQTEAHSSLVELEKNDGSSEVQLGQTRVVGLVTAQLGQPYKDRPNEGSLFINTEFSPMADPSYEPGRPGELAVELGRIIDHGLRESKAVDTESLCVVPGKLVWSLRVNLQILDNGGNLIDAANIAALASLLTFRRPECTVRGNDGQEVEVHPPEKLELKDTRDRDMQRPRSDPLVSEPVSLIVHHLPISVTFALFSKINIVVVDPTYFEEALMEGRLTFTVNINGDVCAIQKPGGVGVTQSIITQCLQIAMEKAADLTYIVQNAVEWYKSRRALGKLNLGPLDSSLDVSLPVPEVVRSIYEDQDSGLDMEKLTLLERFNTMSNCNKVEMQSIEQAVGGRNCKATSSIKGEPLSWDPYPKGADSERLEASRAAQAQGEFGENQSEATSSIGMINLELEEPLGESSQMSLAESPKLVPNIKTNMSLKDAVKPQNRGKNKTNFSATTT